jgi:hypothetical protein
MATTSSLNPSLVAMATFPVQEKLSKLNHATWKAQVLVTIHGTRLEGFLTDKIKKPEETIITKEGDKVPNPKYEDWLATDQQVLSYILASISKEILTQVAAKPTAAEAWATIEMMFASKTRAHAVNTRLALATTCKGAMTVTEYIGKMRSLSDEMAAAGRPLEDEELVEYILTGLDEEYDSVVSSVISRSESISVSELYSQLLAFETRLDLRNKSSNNMSGSSINVASRGGRGCGGFGRGSGRTPGRGGRSGRGNSAPCGGRGPNPSRLGNNNSSSERPICQVCFKIGHTAERCWHRYDENYVPDSRHVAAVASNSYTVNTNWYTDTGATNHITGELEKLSLREKYHGGEQIHTASGIGMDISHVGETTIHT